MDATVHIQKQTDNIYLHVYLKKDYTEFIQLALAIFCLQFKKIFYIERKIILNSYNLLWQYFVYNLRFKISIKISAPSVFACIDIFYTKKLMILLLHCITIVKAFKKAVLKVFGSSMITILFISLFVDFVFLCAGK